MTQEILDIEQELQKSLDELNIIREDLVKQFSSVKNKFSTFSIYNFSLKKIYVEDKPNFIFYYKDKLNDGFSIWIKDNEIHDYKFSYTGNVLYKNVDNEIIDGNINYLKDLSFALEDIKNNTLLDLIPDVINLYEDEYLPIFNNINAIDENIMKIKGSMQNIIMQRKSEDAREYFYEGFETYMNRYWRCGRLQTNYFKIAQITKKYCYLLTSQGGIRRRRITLENMVDLYNHIHAYDYNYTYDEKNNRVYFKQLIKKNDRNEVPARIAITKEEFDKRGA